MFDFDKDEGKDLVEKFLMVSVTLPKEEKDLAEWSKEVTLATVQLRSVVKLLVLLIHAAVPVVMTDSSPIKELLSGVIKTLGVISKSGKTVLRANGTEPFDVAEKVREMARDLLDEPDLPEELRDRLLQMLSGGIGEKKADGPSGDDDFDLVLPFHPGKVH